MRTQELDKRKYTHSRAARMAHKAQHHSAKVQQTLEKHSKRSHITSQIHTHYTYG